MEAISCLIEWEAIEEERQWVNTCLYRSWLRQPLSTISMGALFTDAQGVSPSSVLVHHYHPRVFLENLEFNKFIVLPDA